MNENSLNRFQDLLRTLFQFDCADVDFGIYRILNYKRSQVESFITERLPQIVDQAFTLYAAADTAAVQQKLDQTRQEIVKNLGEQAIDESGQLRNFHRTKLGKHYLRLLEKRAQYQVAAELKTRVYNDLFTFFSRYYEDGDFISKRRYGRHQTYAIPYNGEEVTLYWANRDQYYVKTGDRFKAYRFKLGHYTVAFELRNIAPEQNGNGKKRYFVLAHEAPVTWNKQEKALAIAFEHRRLTDDEEKEHGRTEQQKPQDSLNKAAEKKILGLVADGGLKVALAKPEGTNGASLLRKHLTRFTRKNTADFFIHKDLRGFLRRELDFFIKNEVLLLDELIGGSEEDLREHVQRGRVVRQVAEAIIEFLAQVEDFQKRLWEKKKFVLRTEYCLTIDRVPEGLWDEVLANEAQKAEWRQLYSIEGKVNKGFLKAHPTLVVDTRHFPEDFKWRLLARFDDLDEALDGLLIKSENWQALNLLLEKRREQVKCIYIDPPYNTGHDEFIYRDRYQHSCWLTMIADRLSGARLLMRADAVFFSNIDENEQSRLQRLLETVFGEENYFTSMVWIGRAGKGGTGTLMQIAHENIESAAKHLSEVSLRPVQRVIENCPYVDKKGRYKRELLRQWGGQHDTRQERPTLYFPISTPFGIDVYPKRPDGSDGTWRFSRDKVTKMIQEDDLDFVRDEASGEITVYRKIREGKIVTSVPSNLLNDVGTSADGTKEIQAMFGEKVFDTAKPLRLAERLIQLVSWQEQTQDFILDYFAGSGTTAHAVINLNRQDGGKRKYILVEIGDWFEAVMLPRIKKAVFCNKWKDGKPQGGAGVSHLLKYQYLEQYEDTLNNLELRREQEAQKVLELFGDEYLLKYMLDFETQGSASRLNLDRFKDPFAYILKVQEGDEIVERPVDLLETFNYLLGLQVRKVLASEDNGRPYRAVLGQKNGKRTAIVWRPVVGLEDNEEALMKDRAYIETTVLPSLLGEARPDRLLVNGSCFVKDAEAIEPEFKRLMFAPVGA
jgi:adenine-specific DNA-methyltransferase